MAQRASGRPEVNAQASVSDAFHVEFSDNHGCMSRPTVGVWMLAASIVYSSLDLFGWLHPRLLMLGVNGGPKRTLALVLGSLTFKVIILVAFWPAQTSSSSSPEPRAADGAAHDASR
jgi:hypothetical protein